MDKEIEEILDYIEIFFTIASYAEREYWKLPPDARAQLPEFLRVRFESLSG